MQFSPKVTLFAVIVVSVTLVGNLIFPDVPSKLSAIERDTGRIFYPLEHNFFRDLFISLVTLIAYMYTIRYEESTIPKKSIVPVYEILTSPNKHKDITRLISAFKIDVTNLQKMCATFRLVNNKDFGKTWEGTLRSITGKAIHITLIATSDYLDSKSNLYLASSPIIGMNVIEPESATAFNFIRNDRKQEDLVELFINSSSRIQNETDFKKEIIADKLNKTLNPEEVDEE